MDDEHPDLTWLWRQVDQAHADVRRAESIGPAATLGVLAASLPLLMLLISVATHWAF